ncbi:hypothetical protein HBB16_18680 [Pseudonocardia sp. MCCB 268]|nr:hypothetical protein [Pseudonocardia cytotoxica]
MLPHRRELQTYPTGADGALAGRRDPGAVPHRLRGSACPDPEPAARRHRHVPQDVRLPITASLLLVGAISGYVGGRIDRIGRCG